MIRRAKRAVRAAEKGCAVGSLVLLANGDGHGICVPRNNQPYVHMEVIWLVCKPSPTHHREVRCEIDCAPYQAKDKKA